MEVLINRISFSFLFVILSLNVFSQSDNAIRDALKKSYDAEYQLKYARAIEELTGVYEPSSYELNLRLGWLSYRNNKYVESIAYYKKAIAKMPLSI